MKLQINRIYEWERIVEGVLKHYSASGCLVILLKGELGSGKTTFVKQLGKKLGILESINSPSFLYLKEYSFQLKPLASDVKYHLYHYDLWRVSVDNLVLLEMKKQLKPGNILCIEWWDRYPAEIQALIKNKFVKAILLEIKTNISDDSRDIDVYPIV